MSNDPLNPAAVSPGSSPADSQVSSPAGPLVSSAAQANPGTSSPVSPVVAPQPANIPVSPLPPQPPSDAVSGVMLSQLGQLPVDPSAPPTPAVPPTMAVPSPAGKEGLSGGLPAPTEIPLTTIKSGALEGAAPTTSPEVGAATGGAVEQAPARELEPEVEATQEKIQQREINAPQETVIAAPTMPMAPPQTVSQPVVVLPLSEQGMAEGRKKSPQYSIRWLYVWCVRQIRKFSETLVVYRDK